MARSNNTKKLGCYSFSNPQVRIAIIPKLQRLSFWMKNEGATTSTLTNEEVNAGAAVQSSSLLAIG